MKYAALIALVGASELEELVRVHYPKKTVDTVKGIHMELFKEFMAAKADFEAENPHFGEDMGKFGEWAYGRYGKDLEAWGKSGSVRAVNDHKEAMLHTSKELHTVMSDAYTLYNEAIHGGIEASWGFNADGSYDEYMSNDSARHVFEELYNLAKDVRALYDSPMARNTRRLEKLTLNDPNFQRFFKNLQDDLDVHTWGQLETRLQALGKRVATELKGCKHFQKVVGLLMKMKQVVESERVVTDMGEPAEWEAWWNSKKFTNPFEGMRPDMML